MLDGLKESQSKFNALMDKVDADNTASMDTDYVSSLKLDNSFAPDADGSDAQHKASFRASLRSALRHKKLADELIDSMEELETAFNALLTKLDAEGGTLNDVDYESSLKIDPVKPDADEEGSDAQHKASLRVSLRNALAHSKLADEILEAMAGVQEQFNKALKQLDVDAGGATGALTGLYTPFKVSSVLDPDSASE